MGCTEASRSAATALVPAVLAPSCWQPPPITVADVGPPEPDRPTVQSALQRHAPAYVRRHPHEVTDHQRHVLRRLLACRQPELGSHPWRCTWCGHTHVSYNGCDNRHCARCGGARRGEWLERVMGWSLPIGYLHVVVTLPHELSPLMLANRAALYRLFLRTCSEAVTYVAAQQHGVRVGIVMVLHTWGQQMLSHIHAHQVVSAGGLARDGTRWIEIPAADHALDEGPLSARFRERFLLGLWKLYYRQELVLPEEMAHIHDAEDLASWLEPLTTRRWHTHCQGPPPDCQGGSAVLKYLARYVVGSAISDHRILSDDGQDVTIRAKDYRTGNEGPLTLSGEEFVRRYLLHILPRGFQRVRYCGLFSTRHRKQTLPLCQALLGIPAEPSPGDQDEAESDLRDPDEVEQEELQGPICPRCLMPGMVSLGRHTAAETFDLLWRLAQRWQSVATVLVIAPFLYGAFRLPLGSDELAWSITTIEVDLPSRLSRPDTALPRPDT